MLILKPRIQNYVWGKPGKESLVYQLTKSDDNEKTYAELWMGSYSNMPSLIQKDGKDVPLSDEIKENAEEMLGKTLEKFGKKELPFLFKVLSINKALSIQLHPDPALAEILHEKFPEIYKDSNAKPEMVIALTPFKALCNFCSKEETCSNIKANSALYEFFPEGLIDDLLLSSSLQKEGENRKKLIEFLFKNETKIDPVITSLVKEAKEKESQTERDQLIINLNDQYPNDIGIIFSLFLNYVQLLPGESLEMNPNEPHAYIYGDCIECMKASDNTIRCGLTPKFKDVNTLIQV